MQKIFRQLFLVIALTGVLSCRILAAEPISAPTLSPTQTDTSIPTLTQVPTPIGGGNGQISYWSQRDELTQIYVRDIGDKEGRSEIAIIRGDQMAWSPNGDKIAYTIIRDGGFRDIFVSDTNGAHIKQITSTGSAWEPSWSPDGEYIIFINEGRIFKANADGSGKPIFVAGSGSYTYDFPVYSPNGQYIAYLYYRGGLQSTLAIMKADGSGKVQLDSNAHWASPPTWSPDGKWIAYSCYQDNQEIICLKEINGPGKKTLGNINFSNGSPAWSPDGKWILYVSYHESNWEIYMSNIDGSNEQRLTDNAFSDFQPLWRP